MPSMGYRLLSLSPRGIAMMAEREIGMRKLRRKFEMEALLHEMSGHIPVRSNSRTARGVFTLLKKAGPTTTFFPVRSSEKSGSIVPRKVAKQRAQSTRLLSRKTPSLEKTVSMPF